MNPPTCIGLVHVPSANMEEAECMTTATRGQSAGGGGQFVVPQMDEKLQCQSCECLSVVHTSHMDLELHTDHGSPGSHQLPLLVPTL